MSRLRSLGALTMLSFVATLAEAKVDRVLHEPIPEELYRATPQERAAAAANGARVRPGTPAAGGGQAGAPAPKPVPGDPSRGKASDGADELTIDRDTRRPNVLPYSDPFEPSVAPFKRLHAYDTIADSYVLSESGQSPRTVTPEAAEPNDVIFQARLAVTVERGVPARLPTPGPGARLLAIEVAHDEGGTRGRPVVAVVRSDAADNWDLEAAESGPLVVDLRVAVSPDAFGGDFGDPQWEQLPAATPLPGRARDSASQVARTIGVSRNLPVREVVRKLVAYFRSFQESNEPPPPSGDIYLDLALSRKGVCRHRAFAFLVTARGLGIPARVLTNEAHAWVEVHNGSRWKRIDLGGAGGALEAGVRPPMTPPPDPFAWPERADRGSDLASRASTGDGPGLGQERSAGPHAGAQPSSGGAGRAGVGSAAASVRSESHEAASAAPLDTPPDEAPREAAVVQVTAAEPNARRGAMLPVRGRVTAGGRACAHASVVIVLRATYDADAKIVLGSVPAQDDGSFESSVFVPRELPPGDYQVLAQTAGDSRCARSEPP